MATRTRWVFAVAALVLSACQPNRFVSGWVPYWGGAPGRAVINDAGIAPLLNDVSMLWYGTADNGTITTLGSATSLQSTVDAARAQGLPVIPTIFDSTAAGVMSGILANAVTRGQHVQRIVDLVVSKNYDGIDLDYEVFAFGNTRAQWPAITPNWVSFVREVGVALHAQGKLLSVTIPPVWNDGASGYTVYAQDQIAADVDRLRFMVYDWSVSAPGPISPMSWVNSVIAYSSTRVPTQKLQLGVPAYGRHWATQKFGNEICPDGALYRDSITMDETAPLAALHHVTPTRHVSGELTFGWTQVVTGPRTGPITPPVYPPPSTTVPNGNLPANPGGLQPALRLQPPSAPVTCTVQHTVYVPDGVTVRQHADAALAAGWSGIAIWAFGYETADVYQQLAGVAPQRPGGIPSGLLDAPVVAGNRVTITGHALLPDFDLPVPARLTVSHTGGAVVVTRTISARTSRGGMPAGVGPFHGIDTVFTLAAGNYTVCAQVLGWGGAVAASPPCQTFTVAVP
ncbi:MAG: glycosyl hydrolase family 18 protein [Actinomycetota bacterium]|nr:glycosyl hydrolase family 18 protein [Actinomycetota bacterium]